MKYAAWLEFMKSFPDESVSDLQLLVLMDQMDEMDDDLDDLDEEVDDD